MKTIKQLADELGIEKQKVYRYVKRHHINDVHHDAGVMYLSDAVETLVKSHFLKEIASGEAHHEAHQTASNDAVFDAVDAVNDAGDVAWYREQMAKKDEIIDSLRKENKELRDKLIELTSDVGASLKALTQGNLADKLIEGTKLQQEQEITMTSDKKKWWKRWRGEN